MIRRILPLTQQISVQNQGNYYAQVTEQALDILEMQIQQVSARGGQIRGIWIADADYNYGDTVIDGANGNNTGNYYMCALSNTSDVWATDLAAGDWVLAINIQSIIGSIGISAAMVPVVQAATLVSAVNLLGEANSTGSGGLVRSTSPALTTPTATTLNGMTITGNGATLAIQPFKVFNPINSMTLAGTDGSIYTFQATGTVVNRDSTDTLSNKSFTGSTTFTASSGEMKLSVIASATSQTADISIITNASSPGQCLIFMGKAGATTNGQVGYDPNADSMYFATNNSEKARITSAGNFGIGGTPNTNALLDVQSTTKAFMPPRMTTTQKNAIASPTEGMLVYDNTLHKLSIRTASAWETVTSV